MPPPIAKRKAAPIAINLDRNSQNNLQCIHLGFYEPVPILQRGPTRPLWAILGVEWAPWWAHLRYLVPVDAFWLM